MAYIDIFGTTQLLGQWKNPDRDSPRTELWRVKFPGLSGEGEIYGRPGGRRVTFEIWVYPLASTEQADQMANVLDGMIHSHGSVTEYPDNLFGQRIWDNMTLERWGPIPFGGRVGPLYSPGGTHAGWFFPLALEFYQLLAWAQQQQG